MDNKKLISKENLIKQIVKKAGVSAEKAKKAYECVLNESPAFRTQSLKTVSVKDQVAVKVAGKQVIKKVELKKSVPVIKKETKVQKVEVIVEKIIEKPVEIIKTIEVIKEVPVEVIKEVIREVTVTKEVPIEIIKEVTLVREVVDETEVIKLKKYNSELVTSLKTSQKNLDKAEKSIEKAKGDIAKLKNDASSADKANKEHAKLEAAWQKEKAALDKKLAAMDEKLTSTDKANKEHAKLEAAWQKKKAALDKKLAAMEEKQANTDKANKEHAKLEAAWQKEKAALDKKVLAWEKGQEAWKKKEADYKSQMSGYKSEITTLKRDLAKKPKTIEVIKEVPVEIIKEVQVTKSIDMDMLKMMVGKLGTKQVSKKVVGETRNIKEGKIVSRKEVKPGSTKGKVVSSMTSGKQDDLTRIEGIGPKISEHLVNGGISTFRQLADAKISRLQKILDAAGPRYQMHNPGSWPKQSKLAADGKWEALDKLQEELDGGK